MLLDEYEVIALNDAAEYRGDLSACYKLVGHYEYIAGRPDRTQSDIYIQRRCRANREKANYYTQLALTIIENAKIDRCVTSAHREVGEQLENYKNPNRAWCHLRRFSEDIKNC